MKLQFIEAGEIVTTHGIRGEVKVLPWLDSAEDLCDFDRCRIDGKEVAIEQCRVQKTCNLLKLSGIDTMEAAQTMRGKIIELYREDIDDEDGKVLELRVAEGDMGKVIGRQGRIAKEIRTIIKTVAQRTGEKVTVEIVD